MGVPERRKTNPQNLLTRSMSLEMGVPERRKTKPQNLLTRSMSLEMVPEFSGNWLSCWFALLSAPRCYLVFLAVGCLVFRNCSEAGALFFGSSGLCVNPV